MEMSGVDDNIEPNQGEEDFSSYPDDTTDSTSSATEQSMDMIEKKTVTVRNALFSLKMSTVRKRNQIYQAEYFISCKSIHQNKLGSNFWNISK